MFYKYNNNSCSLHNVEDKIRFIRVSWTLIRPARMIHFYISISILFDLNLYFIEKHLHWLWNPDTYMYCNFFFYKGVSKNFL